MLVKIFTTEGVALRTASLYEFGRITPEGLSAMVRTVTVLFPPGKTLLAGSHSGLSVAITNNNARQTVAVCEKMSQSLFIR